MAYTQQQTALADYAHEAWSSWMRYLFGRSTLNEDGTVTIPKLSVERWQRQMNTPFSELPSEEQRSDYAEAERIERALQQNGEWADAHLFALREQMRAAGIQCETVAEGVAILLQPYIAAKNIVEVLAVNAK